MVIIEAFARNHKRLQEITDIYSLEKKEDHGKKKPRIGCCAISKNSHI